MSESENKWMDIQEAFALGLSLALSLFYRARHFKNDWLVPKTVSQREKKVA